MDSLPCIFLGNQTESENLNIAKTKKKYLVLRNKRDLCVNLIRAFLRLIQTQNLNK